MLKLASDWQVIDIFDTLIIDNKLTPLYHDISPLVMGRYHECTGIIIHPI